MKQYAVNIGAAGLALHYAYKIEIITYKEFIEIRVKDGPTYIYTSMAAMLKEWEF